MDNKKFHNKSELVCQLLMITLIAKNDTLKAKDLAEIFGRSVRTIERWFFLLRQAGINFEYRYGHKGYPPGYEITHIEPELLELFKIASTSLKPIDEKAATARLRAKTKGVTWFKRKFKREDNNG